MCSSLIPPQKKNSSGLSNQHDEIAVRQLTSSSVIQYMLNVADFCDVIIELHVFTISLKQTILLPQVYT